MQLEYPEEVSEERLTASCGLPLGAQEQALRMPVCDGEMAPSPWSICFGLNGSSPEQKHGAGLTGASPGRAWAAAAHGGDQYAAAVRARSFSHQC